MTVTEPILARRRSEESFSTSAALLAMLAFLSADITYPPEIPLDKPYYKAIESSSSSIPVCNITVWDGTERPKYRPKTALGERLMALRNKAIAKGLTLLDRDEIIREVQLRRGEVI
jgi:hypothetical protein